MKFLFEPPSTPVEKRPEISCNFHGRWQDIASCTPHAGVVAVDPTVLQSLMQQRLGGQSDATPPPIVGGGSLSPACSARAGGGTRRAAAAEHFPIGSLNSPRPGES